MKNIRNFFVSIKLTIVLLLTIAASSVIGTLIPQNKSFDHYLYGYGEVLSKIFIALQIHDMYHSWWFLLLIILLAANIIACSLDRLPGLIKTAFPKKRVLNLAQFKNKPSQSILKKKQPPDMLEKIYLPLISKKYGYTETANSSKSGLCIFGEKNRWTKIGVYIVHLSVIILIAGAVIGALLGFDGFVNIPENGAASEIFLKNSNQTKKLDFEIRCDDFNISFYPNNMPKEYRSTLTIIENQKPIFTKDIKVNSPLRYKGINIFQSSYGQTADEPEFNSDKIELDFINTQTDAIYTKEFKIGEPNELPEKAGLLVITDYIKDFDIMGTNIGLTFKGTITTEPNKEEQIFLPVKFPRFDKMRGGHFFIKISDKSSVYQNAAKRYYTGLMITSDPGVWLVYTGFIIMLIGCFISFFIPYQAVCIQIQAEGKDSLVKIYARSNKDRVFLENKVQKLSKELL